MSFVMQTIRYPSGVTEYRVSQQPFQVGEIVARGDEKWIVENVTDMLDGKFEIRLVTASRFPSRQLRFEHAD